MYPLRVFVKKKKINRNVKRNHILTFFLLQNEEKEIKFEMPQNLPTGEFKDLEPVKVQLVKRRRKNEEGKKKLKLKIKVLLCGNIK